MSAQQPRPPRPQPAQLQALTQLANQIRQSVVAKNQNIAQFNNTLRDRIRALDNLSVQILAKIQAIGNRAATFQQTIDRQTAEIADLNRRLQTATDAQADSARQIQDLTDQLQRARVDAAQSEALRQQLAALQIEVQEHTDEINNLTQGIDAANAVITEALGQLNTPDDTAELTALLAQLEAHVNQINQEIDRVNGAAPVGPPSGPQPPPVPNFPPPTSGGKRKRKTKRIKGTFRKTKRNKH
jgi:DNA repair exonuclease SbcCD ATPase subunit